MQDQIENILLQLTFLIDFYRWNDDSLFKNIGRVSWQTARHFSTHIRHMTKHRRPCQQATILEYRQQHQPVVGMTDRAIARIRVGGQKNISLFHRPLKTFKEAVYERAELADNHFPVDVGDHGKFVMLLTNTG